MVDTEKAPNLTADKARDFVARMLIIDPNQRMSVDDALQHPHIAHWWTDVEVNAPPPTTRYTDDVDVGDKSIAEWQALLYKEVKQYEATHDIFGGSTGLLSSDL